MVSIIITQPLVVVILIAVGVMAQWRGVAVITKLSSNSLVNGATLAEKYIFIIFGTMMTHHACGV